MCFQVAAGRPPQRKGSSSTLWTVPWCLTRMTLTWTSHPSVSVSSCGGRNGRLPSFWRSDSMRKPWNRKSWKWYLMSRVSDPMDSVRISQTSPDWCISFSSQCRLCLTSWYLCGEAPGLCGSVLREFRSPAVLHDVGSEPSYASWTETKEQVCEQW